MIKSGGNSGERIGMVAGLFFAQQRLYLAPHHLDWAEIGVVGREETDCGAGLFDHGEVEFVFMTRTSRTEA